MFYLVSYCSCFTTLSLSDRDVEPHWLKIRFEVLGPEAHGQFGYDRHAPLYRLLSDDSTRVVLQGQENYINASHITVCIPDSERLSSYLSYV